MSEMSNYLENAIVNATLRATTFTSPATVYAALYLTDPGEGNTGTEVTGGSYARTAIVFGAPSNGVSTNSGAVTFPTATGTWGTISHMGVMDAVTGGNLLYYTPLNASKSIASGDVFSFSIGNISVTLD